MRIRHYFGNSSPNSTNDRGRQDDPMQELEKDENSDRIKTSTNSKVNDGSKVRLFRTNKHRFQVLQVLVKINVKYIYIHLYFLFTLRITISRGIATTMISIKHPQNQKEFL